MNNTWKMQRKNNKDEKQISLAYKKRLYEYDYLSEGL